MQFDTEEEVKFYPIHRMANTLLMLQHKLDKIYHSNISDINRQMIEQQIKNLENIELTFKEQYGKICNIDTNIPFSSFLQSLDKLFRNEDNVEYYLKELFDVSYSKKYDEMIIKMVLHNQLVKFHNELKSATFFN
jgi:hypothetical protein